MTVTLEAETIGTLLTDVLRLLRGTFDRAVNAAELGLTPGEARTLMQVARAKGIKQSDIAVRMGIEPMTLSASLDRLEELGLVERCADPGDRRAKHVAVTEKADPVLLALLGEIHTMMDQVTANLDQQARDSLKHSLGVLRDNLHGMDRCAPMDKKDPTQ